MQCYLSPRTTIGRCHQGQAVEHRRAEMRRCIGRREPRLQQHSSLLRSARVGSAHRSLSTTSGTSLNIYSKHWFGEYA